MLKARLISKNVRPDLQALADNQAYLKAVGSVVLEWTLWILATVAIGVYLMLSFVFKAVFSGMDVK